VAKLRAPSRLQCALAIAETPEGYQVAANSTFTQMGIYKMMTYKLTKGGAFVFE